MVVPPLTAAVARPMSRAHRLAGLRLPVDPALPASDLAYFGRMME
ncbi:hypothetical protein [Micromonospora sp. NPDC005413]